MWGPWGDRVVIDHLLNCLKRRGERGCHRVQSVIDRRLVTQCNRSEVGYTVFIRNRSSA